MQSKARMTFRFDPPAKPESPPKAPPADSGEGPLYEMELIGWDVPEGSPVGAGWESGARSRTPGPSWWRAFATVAGAIATGALFGYLVLTLFTGAPILPDKPGSQAAPAQATAGTGKQLPADAGAGSGGPVSAEDDGLPAETYYLLQYGVFRSEESMNAALDELKAKGLPGAADRSEGYRVYVGAASTKEEANLLAAQMPGVAVYVKAVTAEAVSPAAPANAKAVGAFARLSHGLAHQLASLTIAALQEPMPQQIDEAELSAVRKTYRAWQRAQAAAEGVAEPAQGRVREMVQALNAAMMSLDDYGKKVSRFHLWRIQADVMQVVLADKALRAEEVRTS